MKLGFAVVAFSNWAMLVSGFDEKDQLKLIGSASVVIDLLPSSVTVWVTWTAMIGPVLATMSSTSAPIVVVEPLPPGLPPQPTTNAVSMTANR